MAYVAGGIVKVSEDEGKYHVAQEQNEVTLPKPVEGPQTRHEIDFGFGPLHTTGYVDATTFEIGVQITVLGIKLGNFYGNLKDSLQVKVELQVAKGDIKFYLRNGTQVWVFVDLKVTFDGHFNKDVKLIDI